MSEVHPIASAIDRALAATSRIVRAFPSDRLDFWPAPNTRTIAEQISHMAHNLEYVIEPVANSLTFPPPALVPADPEARLEQGVARVHDVLAHVPENGWLEPIRYPDDFAMSIMQAALVILEHDAHHRGQLIIALRLLNIEPPPRWNAF